MKQIKRNGILLQIDAVFLVKMIILHAHATPQVTLGTLIQKFAVSRVPLCLYSALYVVKQSETHGTLKQKRAVYLTLLNLMHAMIVVKESETHGMLIHKPAVFKTLLHILHAYATPQVTHGTLIQKFAVL